MLDSYEYRGYKIEENPYGIFIGDMEFISYEEATEWVDSQLEETPMAPVQLQTYRVFFVAPRAYRQNSVIVPNCVDEDDAIDWVENVYCPRAQVVDVQPWF